MAKRYDPILCMMVDDSVKTEDRDPYAYEEIKKDIQIMKSGKASYITKNSLIGRISHSYNNRTITKEQKTELMNLVMSAQDAKKVRDSAKAQDELSLAQKKQVVTELKGYLKKSYNFSDESEYARAYEDLRHMFTTGSRKSISGLFENTVKKTGAQDAKSLGKYKLPNGEIVEVIDRKNVHGVDTIVYKNSRGVHFATVDWFMSNAKKVYDSAKAKDKLVKVPDSKLKDFEANLRSAGFKVVSKSDRGMSTHYQVEVNSSKTFTEADLKEWANKIDAVCDKMDSVAPTTWNIGLTADGKITAGLDVREMYVKDSASALDKAIKTCDGMFQQIFGKYSSAAKQHYDRAVKELDSFKGEIKDYLTLAGKWEMQIRNDLTRIDEAYNAAGNDYYAARREIQETMDSLTQVMLRKAREKRK